MVEAALLMIPFFAILFAIIDYAQIYFYDNSLQNALRESARFATAGRVIPPTSGPMYTTNNGLVLTAAITDSEGRQASRNECIRYWFQSNCVLNIPITNITIFSAPSIGAEMPDVSTNNGVLHLVSGFTVTTNGSNVSTNSVNPVPGPGNAGDYVEITATYHIQTITPLPSWFGGYARNTISGGYPMRVSAIVKNEPAIQNFEHTNMYPDEPNESAATNQQ